MDKDTIVEVFPAWNSATKARIWGVRVWDRSRLWPLLPIEYYAEKGMAAHRVKEMKRGLGL